MSQIITTEDFQSYIVSKTLTPQVASMVVDAINAWVETRTHRVWGETKTIVERYDWARTLRLRRMDIVSITAIKVGWPNQPQTTLDPSGYFFNSRGRVTMFLQQLSPPNSSVLYNDYLEVTYVYGVLAVPDDLIMAVLGIAAGFYNFAVNGQKDINMASVGSYRLEYGSKRAIPQRKPETITAEANWTIVDSYKMVRM